MHKCTMLLFACLFVLPAHAQLPSLSDVQIDRLVARQGGIEAIFRVEFPDNAPTTDGIQMTLKVLNDRISAHLGHDDIGSFNGLRTLFGAGVRQTYQLKSISPDRIQLKWATKDPAGDRSSLEMLSQTGKLHFRLVDQSAARTEIMSLLAREIPDARNWPRSLSAQNVLPTTKTIATETEIWSSNRAMLEYLVAQVKIRVNATESPSLREPLSAHRFGFQVNEHVPSKMSGYTLVYLQSERGLDGHLVKSAKVMTDEFGQPAVQVELKDAAADAFYELTRHSVNEALAIMVDDDVLTAPIILEAIPGGRLQIALDASNGIPLDVQAHQLISVLKSGALPFPVTLLSASNRQPSMSGK